MVFLLMPELWRRIESIKFGNNFQISKKVILLPIAWATSSPRVGCGHCIQGQDRAPWSLYLTNGMWCPWESKETDHKMQICFLNQTHLPQSYVFMNSMESFGTQDWKHALSGLET